jgi:hypothetical protein
MDSIYETNATFPFDKMVLTPPTLMSGGNYFIKFLMNGSPLYIQPPKCRTKGGISKAGKKLYSDLMFTNENPDFIQWMEDLESTVCKSIYENRAKWFESEMELHDIENYFTSPLKIYKSGKFYLVRSNIPTRLGKISLTIYDEDENVVDHESLKEETNLITILEVQGIKCSARSFQIEIEVKQMMTLNPTDLFEKCIIKTNSKPKSKQEDEEERVKEKGQPLENITLVALPEIETLPQDTTVEEKEPESNALGLNDILDQDDDDDEDDHKQEKEKGKKEENVTLDPQIEERPGLNIDLENEIIEDSLAEFQLELDAVPETETVQLKPRNDVYYEMYRAAKRKAKMAKNLALKSYLEAKNIKNTYMLDDTSDTDSDEYDETDEDGFLENLEKDDEVKE